MAPTVNANSSFNLRSILEKEKLFGTNFIEWYRNMIIVLKQEKKEYIVEVTYPDNQLIMHLPEGLREAYQ